MTRRRLLLKAGMTVGILTFGLAAPDPAAAQRATGTLIVRVEEAGLPAAGVDVGVVLGRALQTVGTTGASGLVAVEELPIGIERGTRVSVGFLRCGAKTTALLIPQYESLGDTPDACEQIAAGQFFWGQTERIVIRLDGDQAVVVGTQTEDLRATLSGWRAQGSFLFTSLTGFENLGGSEDFENGFGGEVRVFYLWAGGLGVGGGGSLTKHDVVGAGEDTSKWSAFVEPRYTFLIGSSKIRPHLLVRASYNWFNNSDRVDEKGLGFGAGGGVQYPVTSWLGLESGVYFGYLSTSFTGFDESRDGTELQLTAGLRFF